MSVDTGTLSLAAFAFVVSGLTVVTVGAAVTAWRTEDPEMSRFCRCSLAERATVRRYRRLRRRGFRACPPHLVGVGFPLHALELVAPSTAPPVRKMANRGRQS